MAWVTDVEALEITGSAVTEADILLAQPIIELYSETSPDADDDQTAKTLKTLKYATAYQAAWMKTQIDVTARMDVASLSQDGVSFTPSTDDSQLLAPLAARWLGRLPWKRSRSVFTGGRLPVGASGIQQARENVVYERDDEDGVNGPWLPLYS